MGSFKIPNSDYETKELVMHIDLSKKRALVTGASSGIGAEIACRLAGAGARVAVHGRTLSKADKTVANIESSGGDAFAVEADLTDSGAIKTMFDAAIKGLGGIDIVVNNAGYYSPSTVADASEELWQKTMMINLNAPTLITKLSIPILINQGTGGRLIYISSVSAIMAEYQGGAYCASKAGLNAMARCLTTEVSHHDITVNTVNPGWVDTPMARKAFEEMLQQGQSLENLIQESMSDNPLGRVIKPIDIAAMVIYLASDYGRCITGQDINICNGLSLVRYGEE